MIIKTNLNGNTFTTTGPNTPTAFVVGDFKPELLSAFRTHVQKMETEGHDICPLVVDSYGGYIDTLIAMLDIMDASSMQFPIIIQGKAMSCGADISILGAKGHRYMAPNARMMIHDSAGFAWGKAEDMKVSVEELTRLTDSLFHRIDRYIGRKPGWLQNQLKKRGNVDWYLTAEECLELGFIDHIGIPTLQVDVQVTNKLVL